jgi:hypothetical protein
MKLIIVRFLMAARSGDDQISDLEGMRWAELFGVGGIFAQWACRIWGIAIVRPCEAV